MSLSSLPPEDLAIGAAMQYASTVPFEGDTAKAFDLANAALTSLGFRISSRSELSLELIGPGMTSTRQSPLVGASRLRITRSAREPRSRRSWAACRA